MDYERQLALVERLQGLVKSHEFIELASIVVCWILFASAFAAGVFDEPREYERFLRFLCLETFLGGVWAWCFTTSLWHRRQHRRAVRELLDRPLPLGVARRLTELLEKFK